MTDSNSTDSCLLRESADTMSHATTPSSPASSVDSSHTPSTPTPTGKTSRTSSSSPQGWLSWLSDKYTIQYVIPPAYAPAALQVANTAFPLGILFGLVLPRSISFLATFVTLSSTARPESTAWWAHPQLHLYLLSWVVFHMLEFGVTASYNPTRLFSDSFLLNNGVHYHLAHGFAIVEFALTAHFLPSSKAPSILTFLGLLLIAVGQGLRSMAMIQAHNNFSHIVAYKKRNDHQLVTTGVYAWTRHPSYVGFTYWALGTQLLLGNKAALVGFGGTLYVFFSRRIREEEKWLVEFFGDEYRGYRGRVGSGLPFI